MEMPDITPDLLLKAYAVGIFPMADSRTGEIEWFRPDPRGVIPLDTFHVPRNLARALRQAKFEIRCDTAFADVMRACAEPRSYEDGTWNSSSGSTPRIRGSTQKMSGSS